MDKAGQQAVVLKVMAMKQQICAKGAGKVGRVAVDAGVSVTSGRALIVVWRSTSAVASGPFAVRRRAVTRRAAPAPQGGRAPPTCLVCVSSHTGRMARLGR